MHGGPAHASVWPVVGAADVHVAAQTAQKVGPFGGPKVYFVRAWKLLERVRGASGEHEHRLFQLDEVAVIDDDSVLHRRQQPLKPSKRRSREAAVKFVEEHHRRLTG